MNSGILVKAIERSFADTGNLVAFYSFNNPSGKVAFNNLYTTGQSFYTGVSDRLKVNINPAISIGSTDNPTAGTYNGSGYFNYTDMLQIGTGVNLENWTAFVNYLQPSTPSKHAAVVFSTMNTPQSQSGFTVGLNAANKVFVDYVIDNGTKLTHTFSGKLTKYNNLFSVSTNGGDLQIIHHDIVNHQNVFQNFSITGIKNSSMWRIGGYDSYSTDYSGFAGYIDDFVLFSGGYTSDVKNSISDAFFATGLNSGIVVNQVEFYNSVTGVDINYNAVTGSGVTGYSNTLVKTVNGVPLYNTTAISGALTGVRTTYLTGGLTVSGTGAAQEVPAFTLYDNDYIKKYANDSIVFNKKVGPTERYEIYSYNDPHPAEPYPLNNTLFYDISSENFLVETGHSGKNVNAYMNGKAIYSGSGFSEVEDNELKFSGTFNSLDTGVYNSITGSQVATSYTGSNGTMRVSGTQYVGKDVYFDGIKLTSGYNWSGVSSNRVEVDGAKLPHTSGTLFFLPRYSQTINRVTGSGVQTVNCNFKLIEEQVWLGGLKQKRGIDYFQISSGNLLTSTAVIPTYGQNIVNNPSTFLNT